MRKISNFVLVTLVITLAGVSALAQTAQNAQTAIAQSKAIATPFVATTPASSPATQAIVSSLSILPEADTMVYFNPQRILNELVPKFLPPKDVEGMRKGFEQAKQMAGVDPTKIDYIVIATRFRKPTDDLNFQMPEFMIVASGDFSAESLIALARMASGGKLRDEKYGTKTMGLMTIDPLVKEAEKNPILKSFTEAGIVALNGNTIAVGSPRYLRAAIDAGEGKERISTATLNSLVRDPNALVSIAGTPWHSFAKSFGMLGTETNPRAARCDTRQGDFYAALTMDATNFMLRGAMNADNPDTAKIMSNLFGGFLRHATNEIKDPVAQPLLNGIAIVAEGDEVMIRADVPQQMVMDLMKKHMQPKQDSSVKATDVKTIVKPPVKRRRVKRRG
ncbi:MAG: hypothetical protein H7Z16_19390 [Pyrinomonadaceae bacterium]|nr:hypothetical protein [Pyrinomonadaceae bacterium]